MKEFILKHKFIIIGVFVLVGILIGGTYAWIYIELFGTKTNKIIAGTLELELDESTCTEINVVNAVPTSDDEGMKQVACTFTLENTGTLTSDYTIYLDDEELLPGESRIDDSDVKYSLMKNSVNTIDYLSGVGVHPNRAIDTGILNVGESNSYELRLWIASDASVDAMGKTVSTTLRVTSEVFASESVMANIKDYYKYEYVGEYRIEGMPGDQPGFPINANQVSLTSEFKNAVLTNSSFVDSLGNTWNPGDPLPNPGSTYEDGGSTKKVQSMAFIFLGDYGVEVVLPVINKLDLSLWNTSNVTNMMGMFFGSAATTLDLSGFDTSNVTDMSDMFSYSAATTLDLSNFDISNVIDMSNMFSYSAATTLDLSNFDTSNVIDMSNMFSYSAATTLDLSNFDTRNVTDMSWMFQDVNLTSLDLSSFDISDATAVDFIFSCRYDTHGIVIAKNSEIFNYLDSNRGPC